MPRKQYPKTAAAAQRRYNYKHKYGITVEDYDRMFAEQEGRCLICGTDVPGGHRKHLCVDHCHETGRVRGLLCNRCNGLLQWYEKNRKQIESFVERAFK